MQVSEDSREIKLSDVNELEFDTVEHIDRLVDASHEKGRFEVRAARGLDMLPDVDPDDDIAKHVSKIYEQFPGYSQVHQAPVHLFRTTGVFLLS